MCDVYLGSFNLMKLLINYKGSVGISFTVCNKLLYFLVNVMYDFKFNPQ